MRAQIALLLLPLLVLSSPVPLRADTVSAALGPAFPDPTCPLVVIASELSPGLMLHVQGPELRLFANLGRWGLRPPGRLALRTTEGEAQVLETNQTGGERMGASWLLCWSGEARGQPDFEVPWLVVLQTRPSRVLMDDSGLTVSWPGPGGWVAAMPLYGYLKLPRRAPGFLAEQGLAPAGPCPWEWTSALPPDVVARCDAWAQVLREYPVTVEETFSADPAADTITFRHRYTWLSTDDDWATPHRKFAALPPVLGLAYLGGSFPMAVDPAAVDADLFTPYGPLVGTVGTDGNSVTMPLLKYVNERTVLPTPDRLPASGPARVAADHIAQRMRDKFRTGTLGDIWDHGDPENYCWQVMGDRYYCRALPLCDAATRDLASKTLHAYFADFVLTEGRYAESRGKLLLKGPGIGTWGGYDDAGKFSSNLLETLWEYAQATGDWALIRERWPLILRFFVTPRECEWKGFGRNAIAEMGDEAAPPLCLARMAWHVGDRETYAYACSILARELVHHYVKCRPECAQYFRLRQPWHSLEPMPEEVYLTNLWGETAGWQIDGPRYPAQTGERQYNNRWVRFSNEDVARFQRDVLGAEMRCELGLLGSRPDCPFKAGQAAAHIAPSLEQLRSMLLWERPEDLARLTAPEAASLGRTADAISFYLAFVRTATEPRFERLVPADVAATPFATGLQREQPGTNGSLVLCLSAGAGDAPTWPVAAWWGWPPPTKADGLPFADRLSFGQVTTSGAEPATVTDRQVSWTTRVIEVR